MKERFVSLDIETTDFDPEKGGVIEIGACIFEIDFETLNHTIEDSFDHLVNPGISIPPHITSITSISDEMVSDAQSLDDLADDLRVFVGDLPIVGHNIMFDISFLKGKGIDFSDNEIIDTWKLSTLLIDDVPSHSLEVLSRELAISHVDAHRAYDDVLATKDLFVSFIQEINAISTERLSLLLHFLKDQRYVYTRFFERVWDSRDVNEVVVDDLKELLQQSVVLDEVIDSQKKEPEAVQLTREDLELSKAVSKHLDANDRGIVDVWHDDYAFLPFLLGVFDRTKEQRTVISVLDDRMISAIQTEYLPQVHQLSKRDVSVGFAYPFSDYMCYSRLQFLLERDDLTAVEVHALTKVLLWLPSTNTGLLSEISFTYDEFAVRDLLRYSSHFCEDAQCSGNPYCFVHAAKECEKQYDVVIMTHGGFAQRGLEFAADSDVVLYHGERILYSMERHMQRSGSLEQLELLVSRIKRFLNVPEDSKLGIALEDLLNHAVLFYGVMSMFVENSPLTEYGSVVVDQRSLADMDMAGVVSSAQHLSDFVDVVLAEMSSLGDSSALALGSKAALEQMKLFYDSFFVHRVASLQTMTLGKDSLYLNDVPVLELDTTVQKMVSGLNGAVLLVGHSVGMYTQRVRDVFFADVDPVEYDYSHLHDIRATGDIVAYSDFPGFDDSSYYDSLFSLLSGRSGKQIVIMRNVTALSEFFRGYADKFEQHDISVYFERFSGGKDKVSYNFERADGSAILFTTSHYALSLDLNFDLVGHLIVEKLPFLPPIPLEKKGERSDFMGAVLPRGVQIFAQYSRLLRGKNPVITILDAKAHTAQYATSFFEAYPHFSVNIDSFSS